ncbi:hypothetical protein QN277_015473 [Acacia crassicarpa]|uniref:Trimethylguanosine synthase n=1 Tax=Acacia crassicarpa TaxID=499986 RepID=A0AAE1MR78_9FABA|nr:hypothetical protein QN277_015473 [Acacia crassicarpa]
MDTADSECYGPSIKALGSLFKLTQVFLWDDGAHVSSSAERSRLAEADDGKGLHFVPTTEDMEFTRQMSALGLPLSFHTNKERHGQLKGKRKGKHNHHDPVDEVPSRVNVEEVVSPDIYCDDTSHSFSCLSMLGETEPCHCDGSVGVDNSRCVSIEEDNAAIYTGVLPDVIREQNHDDKNEDVTDGAQDGDLLIRNILLSDDLKVASSSPFGSSAGGEGSLTVSGVSFCGIEGGDQLIDHECLEVSSVVCKDTEHETFCNGDSVTSQPMTHELDSFPMTSEGTGCDMIADSSDCGEPGEWMVYWDTFYERNYFYNIRTQVSTWDPPPGMEHLAISGCTEMDNGATVAATDENGSQNKTNSLEESLIVDKVAKQDMSSIDIGFSSESDNMISDISVQSEGQSFELIDSSSCDDGVSFWSMSDALDYSISSHKRCIKPTSEGNDTCLDITIPIVNGLQAKSDSSMKIQEMKVKRKPRQRRLYNETKGPQFQELHGEYSASIGKYWLQRYSLFSRFDHGIQMDEEGWFSVTPEPIAQHHALRCACGIIVDCFTGVGGNAIQFAQQCRHVIAIDIDPRKIDYATHNASIYGVCDQIDFIIGDFFLLAPKFKADTVFLSPPWGGPDYAKVMTYDMKTMLKPHDGYVLFRAAKEIASKVVMFLPKNIDLNQLAELSLSACPPWSLEVEKVFLNGKLKAVTAYFSDTTVGRR